MKGSELMIGDIVAVNNTPLQIAALGTAKAGFLDAKGEMFYHYYDNIAPIPLTDDILRKNGFKNSDGGWYWCLYENEYLVFRLDSSVQSDLFILHLYFGKVKINYVHELQHALRLCGIEKKIEL